MLLLGTSESGKSTSLLALRLCLQQEYTLDGRLSYCGVILSNAIQSARVVREALDVLELPLEDKRNRYHVQTIFNQPNECEYGPKPEVIHAIKSLWSDAGNEDEYKRRREHQLNDSFRCYAIDIERVLSPEYELTIKDISRCRVMTCGISETSLLYKGIMFKVLDVGRRS